LTEMVKNTGGHVVKSFTLGRVETVYFLETNHDAFLDGVVLVNEVEFGVTDYIFRKSVNATASSF
jgi:hypothetical protein